MEYLPEEILVLILTLLPVKSLIRFACVSKRFNFIILSDPKFGESQLKSAHEHKTLTQRFLLNQLNEESLDNIDTLVFGDPSSSLAKVTIPFELPREVEITLINSSNGIFFLVFSNNMFYAWNPSTGFFKRLPDLALTLFEDGSNNIGVGYFPATNDYRVFVYSRDTIDHNTAAAVFSTKSNAWKVVQVSYETIDDVQAIFFNEALHWTNIFGDIVAFDLADGDDVQNNFRKMAPPPYNYDDDNSEFYNYLGFPIGGFLSLAHHSDAAPDYIEVWVMKTYGESGSWTKIFTLNISGFLAGEFKTFPYIWVMETSTVAMLDDGKWSGLIIIDHKEEGRHELYEFKDSMSAMLYQETLIQLED